MDKSNMNKAKPGTSKPGTSTPEAPKQDRSIPLALRMGKSKPGASWQPNVETAADAEDYYLPPLTFDPDILIGKIGNGWNVPSHISNAEFQYDYKVEEFSCFLQEIKRIPDNTKKELRPRLAQGCLQVIAKFVGAKNIRTILANDELLCDKMARYLTRATTTLLYPIMVDLQEGTRPDIYNEVKVREKISAVFGALTNFFGVTVKISDVGLYTELMTFLHPFWFNRSYDPFDALPFGCLVNFTRSPEICTHYTRSGLLKVNELVARSAMFPSSSGQLPGIMEVLQNLSQVHVARLCFFERESSILEKVVLRLKPTYSERIRSAVAGTLKNLSFEESYHHILVDEKLDILAYAIRPIVGKGEYDEEELHGMPTLLYADLLENKEMARDPSPKVRGLVLDFLYRLCSLRDIRDSLRKQNVYCLLREYHKWETEDELVEYIERVVNLLIQTEDEIGAENLGALSIQQK